jgi:hypothetical protein
MRKGLAATILVIAVLVVVPASAAADPADPVVYFSFEDGMYYPQGANVTFGYACVSSVSAIVSCEASQPMGSQLDTVHAGTHSVTVTATDYEGRHTTATQTYTVIDITKPHIVWRTPFDGATFEQGSLVTADYSCEDDPGGLGMLDDGCVGQRPAGFPIDTSTLGTFTFWVTAVDKQLNITQETVHYSVVDTTPPTIALSSPADGATYTLGQQVSTSFWCDDHGGSGLTGCKGDLANGASLDTSSVGSHSFTVTSYDRAGNVGHETHTYSVVYDFGGFASPASPYPTATSVKAGQPVPLKFSLHGDQGPSVFAAGSPGWTPCGPTLDGPTPADGTLSYNASNDRYTYLAITSRTWAGTCRDIVVTFADGTTHQARFSFTK